MLVPVLVLAVLLVGRREPKGRSDLRPIVVVAECADPETAAVTAPAPAPAPALVLIMLLRAKVGGARHLHAVPVELVDRDPLPYALTLFPAWRAWRGVSRWAAGGGGTRGRRVGRRAPWRQRFALLLPCEHGAEQDASDVVQLAVYSVEAPLEQVEVSLHAGQHPLRRRYPRHKVCDLEHPS